MVKIVINIPNWLEKAAVFFLLLYRRLRYGYPFRRIRLTQGKYAIVDPDDYPRLAKYKWCAVKQRRIFYAQRIVTVGKRQRKNIQMHREIIKAEDGKFCDHINRNGLDNRKANLRVVTPLENGWNKAKQRGKHSSKYKGVSWFRVDKKWQARIQANGRKIFLGYFHDEIDAAKAYDNAALKYHGQFAVLNFES